MASNNRLDNDYQNKEDIEAKVDFLEEFAEHRINCYVGCFLEEDTDRDLNTEAKVYTETLIHVNRVHDILYENEYDELASRVVGIFEDLINAQSEFKSEAQAEMGYSPTQVFSNYQQKS